MCEMSRHHSRGSNRPNPLRARTRILSVPSVQQLFKRVGNSPSRSPGMALTILKTQSQYYFSEPLNHLTGSLSGVGNSGQLVVVT